jgi:hypothetical protein
VREIDGRTLEHRGDAGARLGQAFNTYLRGDISRRKDAILAV